jgi:hypothetical protein
VNNWEGLEYYLVFYGALLILQTVLLALILWRAW